VQALKVMKEGGKIITISTFFTEERPLEQRPYRPPGKPGERIRVCRVQKTP